MPTRRLPHRSSAAALRGPLVAAALSLLAMEGAVAQPPAADEHAAHHPPPAAAAPAGSATAPAPAMPAMAPPPAASAQSGGADGMAGMMGGCMGEGCMSAGSKPLYARLLALPHVSDAERHAIADEGRRRMDLGGALLARAAKEAQWAASMHDAAALARADETAREGQALLRSGAAAHLALARGPDGSQVALDWYRDELGLPSPRPHASLWYGANAGHLILMTALALIAFGLIALQVLRRGRARAVLAAAKTGPPPGPASDGAAQAAGPAAPATATVAPAAVPAQVLASGAAAAVTGRPAVTARPWKGELRVAQVVRETPTVSTFRLVDPAGGRLPFDFLPGQFLQVEVEPTPGASAKRSYTIASAPTRTGYVELTVKREPQGAVSAYLHDHVAAGARLKVAGPYGAFTFSGTDADSIVLIAGGVGVTPMMSVLRYLTDLVWPGEIFFIYSARSTDEMLFREELEQLERRHANLSVLCTAETRTPGTSWLGPEGRLTRELLQAAVPDLGRRRVHLCGPPAMMAAMKGVLQELGVSPEQLRTEAFGPASLPVHEPPAEEVVEPPAKRPGKRKATEVAPQTVTFSIAGVSAPLPSDQTVLEAAEGAGVEIPYSCRSGVCGVCVVKLKQGAVTMAVEDGLDPADKAAGYVLACQAKSTGGDLVVEA
ncbi:2Fe-2S iron-sulfur cluster-binding protein [Phenylobacterium sp.]|uniref:2Fe-2S iron-sulfur cluster-binding protein n=1 Tax=Phenylobacterium sp. TaxID=1871053 RepID=UPI003BA910A9